MCRSVAVGKQSVYMIGGEINGRPSNGNWKFDLETNQFFTKASMLKARYNFGIAYCQEEQAIFIIGGVKEVVHNKLLKHCEKYSVEKDSWSQICKMDQGKQGVSACAFDGLYLYAIGGRYDDGRFSDDIEKYFMVKNCWRKINITSFYSKSMPNRCNAFASQISQNQIIIAGG